MLLTKLQILTDFTLESINKRLLWFESYFLNKVFIKVLLKHEKMLEIKIQPRGNKSVSFEIYSSFFTLKIKMIVVLKADQQEV